MTQDPTAKLLVLLAAVGLLAGCRGSPSPSALPPAPVARQPAQTATVPAAPLGQGPPILPDAHLTPGSTLDVTTDDICTPGYAEKVRDVPAEVKRQVYEEYGITAHEPGEYEVDHLISLELGGSNSIRNLWPQSYRTQPWNAHVKDQLEDELHRLVCAGQVDLKTAQHDISADWIGAYKHYLHTEQPLSSGRARHRREGQSREVSSPSAAAPGEAGVPGPPSGARGEVWVNTRSGKYFYPGARYYGRTKEGEFMPESEARQQGYVPAQRE